MKIYVNLLVALFLGALTNHKIVAEESFIEELKPKKVSSRVGKQEIAEECIVLVPEIARSIELLASAQQKICKQLEEIAHKKNKLSQQEIERQSQKLKTFGNELHKLQEQTQTIISLYK